MKTLDCESIESTYKSLETILGVKESELCQLFDEAEVYGERRQWPHLSELDFLLSYIQSKVAHCETDFDKTCFFHATRTWPNNKFEDGLLPLNQAAEKICDFLFELVKEQVTVQQWAKFRNSVISPNSNSYDNYAEKHRKPKIHGGPVAFLIKEIALLANSDGTDYLASSEFIEDISKYWVFESDLVELFRENTVPFIIKFDGHVSQIGALKTAIMYAYHRHRGLKLDYCGICACCFF